MAKKTEYIQRITVSDGNGNVQDLVVVTPEVFEKMAKNMRKNFRFLDDRIVLATTKGVENARPEFEIADNWTADNRYKYEIESGESLPTLFGKIKRWLYNLSKLAFTGAWGDIQNKPSTFTPSSHTHSWSEINNTPTTYPPSSHSHTWGSITNKPSTYPPSRHSHKVTEIDGLADRLERLENSVLVVESWSDVASTNIILRNDGDINDLYVHLHGEATSTWGSSIPVTFKGDHWNGEYEMNYLYTVIENGGISIYNLGDDRYAYDDDAHEIGAGSHLTIIDLGGGTVKYITPTVTTQRYYDDDDTNPTYKISSTSKCTLVGSDTHIQNYGDPMETLYYWVDTSGVVKVSWNITATSNTLDGVVYEKGVATGTYYLTFEQ